MLGLTNLASKLWGRGERSTDVQSKADDTPGKKSLASAQSEQSNSQSNKTSAPFIGPNNAQNKAKRARRKARRRGPDSAPIVGAATGAEAGVAAEGVASGTTSPPRSEEDSDQEGMDQEPMFGLGGNLNTGGQLDPSLLGHQFQQEHGEMTDPHILAGEGFGTGLVQGPGVRASDNRTDLSQAATPSDQATHQAATADGRMEGEEGLLETTPREGRQSGQAGAATSPRAPPIKRNQIATLLGWLSASIESRARTSLPNPSTFVATPGQEKLWSARMDAIRAAEAVIQAELLPTKAGDDEAQELSAELAGKLHTFAKAVSEQEVTHHFDEDMADILFRAVRRADFFWPVEQSGPGPKLVPISTVLGDALLYDSVAWEAKTACRVQLLSQMPSPSHIREVEAELASFLQAAMGAGKQTPLAHLAFLLWADEAIHHVLTLDDMREKIDLAFGGSGATGLGEPGDFARFYAKPGLTIEGMQRLAQAEAIWVSHFPPGV
ncbi:hypothetical protein LTR36_003281 [Oleoguttula mirabilis]|uniref:Uncharacterized protein n=1 Tax=Oleoguttula mirabilis TaxID=1507867 RepID=A0AAV9JXJ9_9PEZI|nr:hypothetical protein LTR36_003281 [Oleoguttula mirabilis]